MFKPNALECTTIVWKGSTSIGSGRDKYACQLKASDLDPVVTTLFETVSGSLHDSSFPMPQCAQHDFLHTIGIFLKRTRLLSYLA